MIIEYGAKSDVGKVRSNNEDSFAVDPNNGLFIVADGMGGANSGEVASKMAADLISRNIAMERSRKGFEPSKALISSIVLANEAIFEASKQYPQNHGMGTTVVSVLVNDKTFYVGWVGDSRVYLIRHNMLQQVSSDHSLVQEQMNKGLITPEQAETSEFKNVLTRALGSQETVEPGLVELLSMEDDYMLLCSDGLTRMVSDENILEIVKTEKEPGRISNKLIETAVNNGGKDNVTAIVIKRKSESLWERFVKSVVK